MPSVLATNKLTDTQAEQIRALQEQCREHDGIKGNLCVGHTLNFFPEMPCFFLLHEGDALLGVLSIFAPSKLTAEICAYVTPSARRQGHFKRLLHQAIDVASVYGYESVVFVHEYKSADAQEMIRRYPVSIEHTEYLLIYSGGNVKKTDHQSKISIRQVEQADLKEIAALCGNIFGDSEVSDSLTYKSFYDRSVRYYCAVYEAQIIGVCSVRDSDEVLILYGFGIAQNYRGQGFGREFLYDVLDVLKGRKKNIMLEVDSGNMRAFTLYTSSGFAIRTQFDYYLCRLDALEPFVETE